MTNQIQGEILFAGWDGDLSDGNWAYTPWMPVRGDLATYGVQILHTQGSLTLTWNVETREAEDATTATVFASNQTGEAFVTSTTDAKQWVRYRFGTGSTASTSNFVVFRALQPSWLVDR
tara:strand:+ start:78 stop:434 length:357 start_codon:yes stop_codon:yes gene_type:complete